MNLSLCLLINKSLRHLARDKRTATDPLLLIRQIILNLSVLVKSCRPCDAHDHTDLGKKEKQR